MNKLEEGQPLIEDGELSDSDGVEMSGEALYRMDKRTLREDLFTLEKMDDDEEATEAVIAESLRGAVEELARLKDLHPEDPDLMLLQEFLDDLFWDFMEDQPIQDDEVYEPVLSQMQAMIEASPVHVASVEDLEAGSHVQEVAQRLVSLGVESQVVLSGRPDAPVLVLYLQIHPNPGISDEQADDLGVTASQDEIGRILETGLSEGVFVEVERFANVFMAGDSLLSHGQKMSYVHVLEEHPDLFHTMGYEDRLFRSFSEAMRHPSFPYRMSAMNAFLGSNIADLAHRNPDQVSGAIIGMGHEIGIDEVQILLSDTFEPAAHVLPLSHVIAYYGVDVVVADAASSHFNAPAAQRLLVEMLGLSLNDLRAMVRKKLGETS